MPDASVSLRQRALARGLLVDTIDAWGQPRTAPRASLEALLERLGPAREHGPLTPCQRAWRTAEGVALSGGWEPGESLEVMLRPLPGEPGEPWAGRASVGPAGGPVLPPTLVDGVWAIEVGPVRATFVLAPERGLPLPPGWGLFAPVHAIHDAQAPVHGDLGALARLADQVHAAGGAFTATLPLLPRFLAEAVVDGQPVAYEPSPYAPVSRQCWDELLVAARFADLPPPEGFVEPDRVWAAAWPGLVAEAAEHADAVDEWLAADPERAAYARFRGGADPAAVRAFGWAQKLAGEGLAILGVERPLLLDLPLGTHGMGFDVRHHPERFLHGLSVGAPPDSLFRGGQDWGFPPMDLEAAAVDGFAHLRRCLSHHMAVATILRVDHVAWLHRIYCIPAGAGAGQGVYLKHPAWVRESLYGILTLLGARHECAVVGEDLGTVPDEVRQAMDDSGLARTWVLQLEMAEPEPRPIGAAVPTGALASLNTHDLPLFAAWWLADDVGLFASIGLLDEESAAAAAERRVEERRLLLRYLGLPEEASPALALEAALGQMASSKAGAVMVSLEDLWLERRPQNLPGTPSSARPNWRGRAARPTEVLRDLPRSPKLPGVLSPRP